MNSVTKTATTCVGLTATTLLLAGCETAPEEEFVTVTVSGDVKIAAGPMPKGKFYFGLYVLEALPESGELAHPLGEIEYFESESASYSHTFEYPLHKGEGLAVHAWLDTDGDGIFCTPTMREDPSGLTTMTETPAGEVTVDIVLMTNCRAASWFYPPAP